MKENFLLNTVIKKYSHPAEIEYLIKISETGLEDYEEIIVNTYCNNEGRALIIGCGAGREVLSLAKKNLTITGIDIIEKLANICRKETEKKGLSNANFLAMNACYLGFKEESFDYVILLGQLISLIPCRKNRINMLKECKRVLKEQGTLIFTTHSREKNLKEKLKWKIINFIRKLLPGRNLEEGDKLVTAISGYNLSSEKIFIHLYTPKEALEDIKKGGLGLIEYRSAIEIVNNRICPQIREQDKYIVYIAKRQPFSGLSFPE